MALTDEEMMEMRELQTKMDDGTITDAERERMTDLRRRVDTTDTM